ncbi:peptidylprolyl isomerase [Paenibacillus sp. 481]|uniref:peptidylprolyl isomerase n=1 Tax=Paenibacillus sp. 481 TaxID=2835869 RepID=UPI001E3893B5|nr:peptidylprolyl isomerase [Paenibacillus sp. 481]UHA75330.1 peptidylprolyl isomerase [Paenibacillus sp. 481]
MLQNNKKRSKKFLLILMSAVMALSVLAGCGDKSNAGAADKSSAGAVKDTSPVVAKYEGGEITKNEFDKEIALTLFFYPEYAQLINMEQFREYFVKQQIAYIYIVDKASDKEKADGKKKAEEQLAVIKKNNDKQLQEGLKTQKLTEAEVKDFMARNFIVVEHFNNQVKDENIKAQYEKMKPEFTTASVRHVLVALKDSAGKERKKEDALKKAKEIQARLNKGEDFAKLATQLTDDEGSKKTGGLYKDAKITDWVPEFKAAAATLPLNKVSDPVETQFGYHVMRVESRNVPTLDKLSKEQKDQVKVAAAGEIMAKFMENDLKKIIKEVKLPKPEPQKEAVPQPIAPETKPESGKAPAQQPAQQPKQEGTTTTP